ncbi:MAG: BrnA antitoxin family protein [Pyrinomonadaceae bacterium]
MSKISKRPNITMPSLEEDRAITTSAKADPDAQPLTLMQMRSMVPMHTLRGRPRSANPKQLVSIRYSPEVLAYFKSTGEGWQTLIDRVLREYVSRHTQQ